jgi:nitrous oxidase accessory protein NosD
MKKFFGILIIATGISVPAYAQSFDADNGTGNLITAIAAPAPVVTGSVTRKSGTEAYAMSARRKVNAEATYNAEPAGQDNGTGGGSAGYNEMLRNW